MKKLLPACFRSVLFSLLVLLSFSSRASHIVGGDLFYNWISGNTYKITVILYGDCGSGGPGTPFENLNVSHPVVCVYNGATPIGSVTLDPDVASAFPNRGTEITPVCIDSIGHTQCNDLTSGTPGIKKFTYTNTFTFPGTSPVFRLVFNGQLGVSTAGRSAPITNILTPGSTVIQLIDTLNNTAGNNNSPILTVVPTPFFATVVPNCYTPGAIDPDLDSLSFDLISATNGTTNCSAIGGPNTYIGTAWPGQPVTAITPITCNAGSFAFDGTSGQICFTSTTPQRSIVVFNVREFRGGVFVGSSQREMTFLVKDFPFTPPVVDLPHFTAPLDTTDATHFFVCEKTGPFSFQLRPKSAAPTIHITCTAAGLGTSGLTFNVDYNNTDTPICTLSGNATTMAPGIYNFFITFRDDGCPISSTITTPYRIQIYPQAEVTVTKISDADCVHGAVVKITPGGNIAGSAWTVKTIDSTLHATLPATDDTIESHTSATAYYDTLDPHSQLAGAYSGSYNFVVYTSVSQKCFAEDSIKLLAPPQLQPDDSFASPTYCGASDGLIILRNLNPLGVDTVTFNYNGSATPESQIHVVGTDGKIIVNSLKSGIYGNIVVHYGFCTSQPLAPADTLVDSVFHFRNITTTDATKCGFCDGYVRINGLHPGQIDSVIYSYTSVSTPTVFDTIAYYVGPDSSIVMPGMCKGSYNSFTIWTQASHACSVTPSYVGNIDALPIHANFDTLVHLGCHGDTIAFHNLSTPASDLHYSWFFGDGTTSDLADPVHVYHNTDNASYPIKLFITNTKCVDSAVITRTFNNTVASAFTMDPPSFICQQKDSITLTNAATGTDLKTLWVIGDGTTDTAKNPKHGFTRAGVYNVMLVATNGVPCSDTMFKTITVDSLGPVSMEVTSSTICRGQTIYYNAIYPKGGDIGNEWRSSDGFSMNNVNGFNHAFDGIGTFTVDVTANFRACPQQTTSRTFTVFDYPTLYAGPDMTICTGSNPIQLMDTRNANNPKASWRWNTDETTPGITVVKPGEYVASVTIDGCTTSDTVSIVRDCYMDIPNVFTPNGDGVNDYFFPRKFLTRGVITFKMNIYNRWGQLIYETSTTDGQGWDGTLNGTPQTTGTYVYVIDATYKDGQIEHHNGNVTLLK